MSGSGPKSDRPPASRPDAPPATSSRPGFVTMPTELRAFQKADPNAGALKDAEIADAAAKLRQAGRGPDVLFEELPAERLRDPNAAADENRSEHVIVEMPAGVSPWVKDAAAVREAAAVTVDKAALPPASAGRSDAATVTTKAARPVSSRRGARPDGPDRRWLVWIGLAASAVLLVVALRPRDEPGSHDEPTGELPAAVQATGMTAASSTGAMTGATATGVPAITGAPATTGEAPSAPSARATGAQPFATGAASSTRTAPRGTADLYVDAGALPHPPASAQPSVAPVVSSAPTAPPVVTSAPSSSSSNPLWFPKNK